MAAHIDRGRVLCVLSVLQITVIVIEAAYTSTPGAVSGCIGGSATFTWVYDNQGDASSVVWDFGSVNVFNYQPSTGNTVQGAAQFAGRVTHNGDGSITLNSLTTNDAGSFTCTVNYNSNPIAVNAATLIVNAAFTDSISTVLTVSGRTATVNLGSQNGVGVEWKNTAGTVVGTGTTFTGDGTFTVCLTGCVSGSATACQQVELKSKGLTDGEIAAIVFGCLFSVAGIVAAVVLGLKKKYPCQKGSQNKNQDSGNSGMPKTESGNATNQGNETKDPLPKTDDKGRHQELQPLTNVTNVSVEDGTTVLNRNEILPGIPKKSS